MALTIGTDPFGDQPAGRFDVEAPARPLLFWEPFPRRLRVASAGGTVADSRKVIALHETGQLVRLCVPKSDTRLDLLNADPVTTESPSDEVMIQRSSRHVVVRADDTLIAETSAPAILFETSMPPHFYVPPDTIRSEVPDEKRDGLPNARTKGYGKHWHVKKPGGSISTMAHGTSPRQWVTRS